MNVEYITDIITQTKVLYQAEKWNKCLKLINEFFEEIKFIDIPKWTDDEIIRLARIENFNMLIAYWYDSVVCTGADWPCGYQKSVDKLQQHGLLPFPKDSAISLVCDAMEYKHIPVGDIYTYLKKVTLGLVKSNKLSYLLIMKRFGAMYMSFFSRERVLFLKYILPIIKHHVITNDPDLPGWLHSMRAFISLVDGNDKQILIRLLTCIVQRFVVESEWYFAIIFLLVTTLGNETAELFEDPYFKNLRRLSLNKNKYCNVCYNIYSKVCVRCKSIRYCSRECQIKDWSNHKPICKVNFKEPNIERPKPIDLSLILGLLNTLEEKYKDDTWKPFD